MKWLINKHGEPGLVRPAEHQGARTHYAVIDDYGVLRRVCRRPVKRAWQVVDKAAIHYGVSAVDCKRCVVRMADRVAAFK